jgi:hypothetical protein
MNGRVVGVWSYDSGDFMGDPISLKQDFDVKGNVLEFYNGEKFFLVACYSNQLLLYSAKSKRFTRYSYGR